MGYHQGGWCRCWSSSAGRESLAADGSIQPEAVAAIGKNMRPAIEASQRGVGSAGEASEGRWCAGESVKGFS